MHVNKHYSDLWNLKFVYTHTSMDGNPLSPLNKSCEMSRVFNNDPGLNSPKMPLNNSLLSSSILDKDMFCKDV